MNEQSKANHVTNRLTGHLFFIYLIALCWILLLKLGVRFSYMGSRRANLIPFSGHAIFNGENILNIIIFVPLGIYVEILLKRWTFGEKLLFVFSLSFLFEGAQYFFRLGAFDVTDLMTNTLGGIIGLMIFKAIENAFNNRAKAQKFVNRIAATGTILMTILLVLLKMNLLPIRYQ